MSRILLASALLFLAMAARGQEDMDSPKRMMGTYGDMPEAKLGGRHTVHTTGDHPVDDHLPNFDHSQPNPDGSVCIEKTSYVEKLERAQIKECWHQNITACHYSSVTEFKSMQHKKCEEHSFHKTCKITFKEVALNYTVRTCHKPLVQQCKYRHHGYVPVTKCRTWFETVCNTTLVVDADGSHKGGKQAWCEKIPKKICAPDHCAMVEGPEVCHDKTIYSTIMKPEETCDLQPTTDCQIVTNLIPHLIPRKVCETVPKEFCHTKLDKPKMVKKPVTMKWCTYVNGNSKPAPHGHTKHPLNHTTLLPLHYQHPRPYPTTTEPPTVRPTTTTSAPETTTRPYYYYQPEPSTHRPYPETTTPPEPTTVPYYYYQPTSTTTKPTPPPTRPPPPPPTRPPPPPPTRPPPPPPTRPPPVYTTTPESYYPYYQPEQPRPIPQQNDRIPSIFNGFLNQHQQHHSK